MVCMHVSASVRSMSMSAFVPCTLCRQVRWRGYLTTNPHPPLEVPFREEASNNSPNYKYSTPVQYVETQCHTHKETLEKRMSQCGRSNPIRQSPEMGLRLMSSAPILLSYGIASWMRPCDDFWCGERTDTTARPFFFLSSTSHGPLPSLQRRPSLCLSALCPPRAEREREPRLGPGVASSIVSHLFQGYLCVSGLILLSHGTSCSREWDAPPALASGGFS